jgi:predicted nucleic acid-binding protein
LKIFLDTSLLSDAGLAGFGEQVAAQVEAGTGFYVSSVTHFQLLWGYSLAGMSAAAYEEFLERTGAEVVPLTKLDAKEAAGLKPVPSDVLDALIAASVRRYDAGIWTLDRDFLKFLPRAKVRVFKKREETPTGTTATKSRKPSAGPDGET